MKNRHKRKIDTIFGSQSAKIDATFKEELKHKLFKENSMATNNNKIGSFTHNLKQHKLVPLSAALVVAVAVAGISIYTVNNRAQLARENEISLPADLTDVISIEEVKGLALADSQGVDIIGVELEQEDGVLYYKVKFSDGSFRLYNAKTGELVINKDGLEVDETVPADFVPTITLEQAIATAKEKFPGVQVEKVELEVENGVVVYSVRFVDDSRVDVSAVDGSVVRMRAGDDDSSEDESENESEDESDDDNSGSGNNESEDESDDDNSGSGNNESEDESDDDNSGSGRDSSRDDSEDESNDD